MLSEETYTSDETKRRDSDSSSDSDTVALNDSPTPRAVLPYTPPVTVLDPVNEELDSDVLEAIRRSLEDASLSGTESPPPPAQAAPGSHAEGSTQQEDADLEFAVQLSIAEQRSLGEEEEFPTLCTSQSASSSPQGRRGRKGKEVFRG
jgi:hypothetical protein